MLANFLRSFRIKSDRALRGTGHARDVAHAKSGEIPDLLKVESVNLPEMQSVTRNGAKEVRICHGLIPSHGSTGYYKRAQSSILKPEMPQIIAALTEDVL